MVNVIISAYDSVEFSEECLDSVQAQTYRHYKILLGIDGCQKTLQKVLKIAHKYDNMSIYYNKKNCGVYKMFNTLAYLVPDNEYLQFFGADDVMHEDFLEKMSAHNLCISKHVGVLFVKSEVFKQVGGYRAWRCGADADMIYRLRLLNKKHEKVLPQHFYRRVHSKQLTQAPSTGLHSELRQKYMAITERNYAAEKPDIYAGKNVS